MTVRSAGARRWRLVRGRRDAGLHPLRGGWRRVPARLLWLGGLTVVLTASGMWVAYGTSLLGVRSVVVSGAQLTSAEQVRAAAGVAGGTPMIRVDPGAVAERVRALAPVRSVTVRRSWPSTLVIEVSERVGVVAVAVNGAFVVVDAEGVAFRTVPERPSSLPLVEVDHPGPDDRATLAALRVVASLTPELRAELERVVAASPTRIHLDLAGSRRVIWGDAEQSERKAQVATVLLAEPATTIDVSAPDAASTS